MATYTEGQRPLEAVLYEEPVYSRASGTIASGAGVVAAGTVLGAITASGKYTPYDDGSSDGSETAVAVSLYEADATDADVDIAILVRHAVVKEGALQWHADADATAKAAAAVSLASAGIIVRS